MIDLYADRPDLYDLLHDGENADASFFTTIAHSFTEPGGHVLELGCGTGRIAEALLDEGYDVTGVDASPVMLERAEVRLRRFQGRFRGMHGDMAALPGSLASASCDLVVVAANTFMHLESHALQLSCLAGIQRILKPQGIAVLDLADPFYVMALPQHVLSVRTEQPADDGGSSVLVTGVLDVDPTYPRLVDRLYIDEVGADGLVRRSTSEVALRLVFMPELELLLSRVGLGIADAYGDYELTPYGRGAERMIAVLRPF